MLTCTILTTSTNGRLEAKTKVTRPHIIFDEKHNGVDICSVGTRTLLVSSDVKKQNTMNTMTIGEGGPRVLRSPLAEAQTMPLPTVSGGSTSTGIASNGGVPDDSDPESDIADSPAAVGGDDGEGSGAAVASSHHVSIFPAYESGDSSSDESDISDFPALMADLADAIPTAAAAKFSDPFSPTRGGCSVDGGIGSTSGSGIAAAAAAVPAPASFPPFAGDSSSDESDIGDDPWLAAALADAAGASINTSAGGSDSKSATSTLDKAAHAEVSVASPTTAAAVPAAAPASFPPFAGDSSSDESDIGDDPWLAAALADAAGASINSAPDPLQKTALLPPATARAVAIRRASISSLGDAAGASNGAGAVVDGLLGAASRDLGQDGSNGATVKSPGGTAAPAANSTSPDERCNMLQLMRSNDKLKSVLQSQIALIQQLQSLLGAKSI